MTNPEDIKFKKNIQRAIELYKQLYHEVMTMCDSEITTASLLGVANKLYARLKSIESTLSHSNCLSTEEQRAVQRLQLLSQYLENINGTRQVLADTKRAKELQGYIKGGVKVPSGVEDSERLQSAMELMQLIHSEFQKSANISKNGADSERVAVESIISKALKAKGQFADVDLSEYSPARAVLNEMLTLLENQKYIDTIAQIFEERSTALQVMRDVHSYGEDNESNALANARIIQELLSKKFEIPSFSSEVLPFSTFEQELQRRINDIAEDKHESSELKVKQLQEFKKQAMASIDKSYGAYTRVIELLTSTDSLFNSVASRYIELLDSVPSLVREVKAHYHLDEERGFVDGINLYGKSHILSFDNETGGKIEKEKSDEDILITDESLLTVLLTRVLVHASCIKNNYKKQLAKCGSIQEVESTLSEYQEKLIKLQSALESDYDKARAFYGQLIYYRIKMDSYMLDTKRSVSRFMSRFNPVARNPKFYYFNDEQLAGIRDYGRRALISQVDAMKPEYLELSARVGSEIVEYITSLTPRTSVDDSLAPFVDLHTVAMNAGAMAEAKQKALKEDEETKKEDSESQSNEDEENPEDKSTIFEIFDLDFSANEAFSKTLSGTTDVKVLLENPRYRAVISALVPFIGLESGLREIESMREASRESDIDRRSALVQRAITCESVLKMKEVSKTNSFLTDEFYEYLAKRMGSVSKLVGELGSEYMAMLKGVRGRASVSIQVKLSAEAYYALIHYCGHWLNMLHSMDEDMIRAGESVYVGDRDMELEKTLIEKYKRQLKESKQEQAKASEDQGSGSSEIYNKAVNLAPLV